MQSLSDEERALLLDDSLVAQLGDSLTVVDQEGRVRITTAELRLSLGYPDRAWEGRNLAELVHPDDMVALRERFAGLIADPHAEIDGEIRIRHAHGHWEIVTFSAVNRLDTPLEGILIAARIVSRERHRERLRAAESGVLELIGNGAPVAASLYAVTRLVEEHTDGGHSAVLLLDDQDVLRAGAAPNLPHDLFRAVDGLRIDPEDGALGSSVRHRTEHESRDLWDEPHLETLRATLARCGLRGYWSVPITYASHEHGYGSIVTFYPHQRGPGPYEREAVEAAARLAGIAIERDRLEAELHHLVETDLLTGLPNRATLTTRLDRILAEPRRDERIVGVMFLDIDAFNLINDSLGHAAGDALLTSFAERIERRLPAHTTFGRFGGDEFVIMFDHPAGTDEAWRIGAGIEEALAEPFRLGDHDVFLAASIGVAAASRSDATADELLGNADTAMYEAKRRGRGGFVVFEERMRTEVVDQLQAESSLRHAIDRHEFTLRYQPKIDLGTGRILGAEALLRWNHPEAGLVGPAEVIPWAENTGLIVQLGAWVLETAVHQSRTWIDLRPDRHFLLAVNVSGRQLSSPGFPQTVAEVLARYQWPPESLCLEITESTMISDTETSLHALRRIKELGVLLAVDDFGTGYSSLSYLHRFPIDVVKVDRNFVADMGVGSGSPVAEAVVAMTRALRLRAAAEGIETEEQLSEVRRLGCEWGQGFLFSRAVPPGELTDLLRRDPGW